MQDIDGVRETLHRFGLARFRRGQERVITALLEGRSALAVFPTGGGKSLCYQLPALMLDGLTLVISPLIALMKDQVDSLTRLGLPAARLDSSLDAAGTRKVYEDLRAGRLKLLYVAPERLSSERFLHAIAGRVVSMLAVDEAHCISEWGHNFRPIYLKSASLADRLPVGRVLALTATATPEVARDIADAFHIDEADIVATGFHRPNLELHATPCRDDQRRGLLLDRLRTRPPGAAIVYVTKQKSAEELSAFLVQEGFDSVPYHSGLDDELQAATQKHFMTSGHGIVVATIPFGMGIDKPDIRYIYHYNLPRSLEGYSQEIGRAGRDGLQAICESFSCAQDVVGLENISHGVTPTPEEITKLLDYVMGLGPEFDLSIYELAHEHDLWTAVVQTLLAYLELEGVLESTEPFYCRYEVRLLRPITEILANLGTGSAELIRQLLWSAMVRRKRHTLDVVQIALDLDIPRARIAGALSDLEEKGDVVIEASGCRQGYRLKLAPTKAKKLSRMMIDRFQGLEGREIVRLHEMLEYSQGAGCLTGRLLAYFGEELSGDCGHCGRCLGLEPGPIAPVPTRAFGQAEKRILANLRAEGHNALTHPRQLTRFLCGLTSPSASRAKLAMHASFGALSDLPFAQVLAFTEGED
jgi:ATP-dependent DNA helicase RecQ